MKSSPKLKAKFLSFYYGNPIKDMKLIVVTGKDKVLTTHYIHEILKSASKNVAALAAEKPFNIGMLHKFLSDAWKAGADYVIVTAPKESIENGVFYSLPILTSIEIDQEKPIFKDAGQIITNTDAKLLGCKNYKKGTEVTLAFGSDILNLATFATGDQVAKAIATAATFARTLNISNDAIIDGIANYDCN